MSGVKEELVRLLARFDDDAFVALANRGLLRRAYKDLEKSDAAIVEESAEALTMAFGEYQIRFDRRGPGHAVCSCRAGTVCHHVLGAALILQRIGATISTDSTDPSGRPGEGSQEPLEAPQEPRSASQPDLRDLLLAFTPTELTTYCGRAGYRWAWQYVQDLDGERGVRIDGSLNIVIAFQQPQITFRYVGGGLENLVADVRISSIEKYVVAAVLAFRRANGAEIVPPASVGKGENLSLALGEDFISPAAAAEAQLDSRRRLRVMVKQIAEECLEVGLSHLSRGMQQRFTTLSVWAQGADYHRLARLLRRVADQVEMLAERVGNADEHLLLDELSMAYALVSALEEAAEKGMAPVHLTGKARGGYEAAGSLELVGLGAVPWRAKSGFVGLTVLFWSKQEKGFLTYSDARPETQLNGFNPFARYTAPGPWAGLGSPSLTAGRRLSLFSAKLSEAGRLSGADSCNATLLEPCTAAEIALEVNPFTNWTELNVSQHLERRSLLGEQNQSKSWVALQPKIFGRPKFDGNRQTLVWPLYDEGEQRLDAELLYSDYTLHAITRLEREGGDVAPGTIVFGRLRKGLSGTMLEPVSLMKKDGRADGSVVDVLHFDSAPTAETEKPGILAKFLARLSGREEQENPPETVESMIVLPVELREMGRWLRQASERGVSREADIGGQRELLALCGITGRAGFNAFSMVRHQALPLPELLLQVNYLRMQYERLMGDSTYKY